MFGNETIFFLYSLWGLKEKAQPGDVTSAGWANKRRNIKEKR